MKPSEDYDEQLLELYNMTVYSERKTIHDLYTSVKSHSTQLIDCVSLYCITKEHCLQRELAEKIKSRSEL